MVMMLGRIGVGMHVCMYVCMYVCMIESIRCCAKSVGEVQILSSDCVSSKE